MTCVLRVQPVTIGQLTDVLNAMLVVVICVTVRQVTVHVRQGLKDKHVKAVQ